MELEAHDRGAPDIDFDDYATPLRDRSLGELRAANLVFRTIQSSWLMKAGRGLARLGLALHIPGTAAALERTVFRQFCGGTSLEEALATAERLHTHGIRTILDYAAEGEDSEAGFDDTRDQLLRQIEAVAAHPAVAFCATKLTGLASFDLLERASSDQPLDPGDRAALARGHERIEQVARRAREVGQMLYIDAEHSWVQPAIDEVAQALMRAHNRERPVVHTTVQLYLRRGLDQLESLIADARANGYQLGVKLVRGAYMELENERAVEHRVDSPIQPSKQATDAAFDRAITLCLENLDRLWVCVATHNLDSTRHLMTEMARLGIDRADPRVTASQLLGMFDRVTFPLARRGYNALKYVPYGAVREAFPYLLRRADENRSIAGQMAGELDAIRAELGRRGKAAL
jgi:proline dehydrogenase